MKIFQRLSQRANIALNFRDIPLDVLYADFQPCDAEFHRRNATTAGRGGASWKLLF